jgi:hypothetical protein
VTGTVGLVRVLTTDDVDLLEAHGRVIAAAHGLDAVLAAGAAARDAIS